MLICTAVYCLQMLSGRWVEQWFALWPYGTGYFQPWQLLTYTFLHGGPAHLFFNMLGLWSFGSELELVWGRERYLRFLAVSTVAGAVLQTVVVALGLIQGGPVVGASGALFGLLLGFGLTFPDRIITPLIPPIPMKAKVAVFAFAALSLVMNDSSGPAVAHFVHGGGMLGGWLMIRYWRGQPPFPPRRRRR